MAKENKMKFFETSAYSNYNVTELFSAIGSEILEKIIEDNTGVPENNNNLILSSEKNKNNNTAFLHVNNFGCCWKQYNKKIF